MEGQAHSGIVDELYWKGREVEVNLQTMRTQLVAAGVFESMRPVAHLERSSLVPLAEEALSTVTWLSYWKWDFYMFCVSLPLSFRVQQWGVDGSERRCVSEHFRKKMKNNEDVFIMNVCR